MINSVYLSRLQPYSNWGHLWYKSEWVCLSAKYMCVIETKRLKRGRTVRWDKIDCWAFMGGMRKAETELLMREEGVSCEASNRLGIKHSQKPFMKPSVVRFHLQCCTQPRERRMRSQESRSCMTNTTFLFCFLHFDELQISVGTSWEGLMWGEHVCLMWPITIASVHHKFSKRSGLWFYLVVVKNATTKG